MSFISLCSLLSCADPSDRILVVLSSLPCEHYLNKCNICWSPPRLGHVMTMHCGHVGGDQVCSRGNMWCWSVSGHRSHPGSRYGPCLSSLMSRGIRAQYQCPPSPLTVATDSAYDCKAATCTLCVLTTSGYRQPIRAKSWVWQPIETRKPPTLQQLKGAAQSSTRSNEAIKHWHILGRVVVAWISLIVFSFTCVILIIILGKSLIMLL